MIRNSKQIWAVGSTVKVGFLTLVVKAALERIAASEAARASNAAQASVQFNEIFAV